MALGTKHKIADAKVVTTNFTNAWEKYSDKDKSQLMEMVRVCTYSRLVNIELMNDAIHDFYAALQKTKYYRHEIKRDIKLVLDGFIKYCGIIYSRAGEEAIEEVDEIKDNFMPELGSLPMKLKISIKQDLDNANYKETGLMAEAIFAEQVVIISEKIFDKDVEDFISKIPVFGKYIDVTTLRLADVTKRFSKVVKSLGNTINGDDKKATLHASDNTQKLVNLMIRKMRDSDATVRAVVKTKTT